MSHEASMAASTAKKILSGLTSFFGVYLEMSAGHNFLYPLYLAALVIPYFI